MIQRIHTRTHAVLCITPRCHDSSAFLMIYRSLQLAIILHEIPSPPTHIPRAATRIHKSVTHAIRMFCCRGDVMRFVTHSSLKSAVLRFSAFIWRSVGAQVDVRVFTALGVVSPDDTEVGVPADEEGWKRRAEGESCAM